MTQKSNIKFLTQAQVQSLFSVINDLRDRALFCTIYHCGLRVGEVPLIRLDDLDLERRRITITRLKNGYGGELPLFEDTAVAIERYLSVRLQTCDALYTGRQGGLKRNRIQQLFNMYARIACIDRKYSLRALRHSIATHMLDSGVSIEFVQEHLGHVNIQNTLIYAKLTSRRKEAVYRQIEKSPEIVKLKGK